MQAIFLHLLPLASSLAAATALTATYGVLSVISYAFFAVWCYSPYLSTALGAGGKFIGFLLRSIFLVNHDVNVFAASTVFLAAGMSACTSAQAAVLGDWFKHSAAAQRLRLHRQHPRLLPAACRLMSLPVLVFGPGIGVPAAILMYRVKSPSSFTTALRIRKWSAWGTLACLIILTALALLAMLLAILHHRQGRKQQQECKKAPASPIFQVAPVLASILLIQVSGAARVRNLYQPTASTNDHLYYPLIVLPELLQQLLAAVPTLLHRCGLADSYASWRTTTWPWVGRAFPATLDAAGLEAGQLRAAAPATQPAFLKAAAPGSDRSSDDASSASASCGKLSAATGASCGCMAPPAVA